MDVTEVSLIHHVAIVLLVLWFLNSIDYCHPIAYFMSLIYLFLVHERYVMRLRKKLQFEERKQANQRRVLCDSETVRWLNYAVEKMWPICMEPIASQKILLPIIPWFLDKYKPWTAEKVVVQHLYLGRNPPIFTEMRVHESNDDDHLVLELGMNFLTADDMSAVLAVQLRKRIGFGMWTKLHMTGMHIEGKVLVGVKFLRYWPFLGRLRLCFLEPPYVQMNVKPLFNHGLDVTEFPGIAGWLEKLLSIAFEQTLVEPNMLVVDLEKFASPQPENWFFVDGKEPVAFARVEVIEGSNMRPADLNGLADPYVKGELGPYRFRTKTQKKTLTPKWQEEFKIPICSWDSPNILEIEVCDKDHFVDDALGECSVNISDFRDGGQRHSLWLTLKNVKTGRLHLAITVVENNGKVQVDEGQEEHPYDEEKIVPVKKGSDSSVADVFEPINIEGQEEAGIWVQQPGSQVSQTWEPRKGKGRHIGESNNIVSTTIAVVPGSANTDNSSADESLEGAPKSHMNTFKKGLFKINSAFHKSPRRDDHSIGEDVMSPRPNLRSVNTKDVRFVVEDSLSGPSSAKVVSSERIGSESPPKLPHHGKGLTKSYLKQAGRSLKHVLSRKGSRKGMGRAGSVGTGQSEVYAETDSNDDEPSPIPRSSRLAQTSSSKHNDSEIILSTNPDSLDMRDENKYHDCFVVESSKQEDLDRKDTDFT